MSSSSSLSEASTAPSTPSPACSYFLLEGQKTSLNDVGARLAPGDILFFFSGVGSSQEVQQLLKEASDAVLDDDDIAERQWTSSCEGKYYYAKPRSSYAVGDAEVSDFDLSSLTLSCEELLPTDAAALFTAAKLHLILTPTTASLRLFILARAPLTFPLLPTAQPTPLNPTANPFGVPSRTEWENLWAVWDAVTLGMIPRAMLHQKPIDLRHKCLFYLGHIPTFLDMLLSALLGEPNTDPVKFTSIFERGIDPHVDDPEHCHRHSEVPTKDEDWPNLEEIIAFCDRVRARLLRLYDDLESGKQTLTRRIARTLVMTHEHEGFHVETLLYMLIQRAGTGTLPPPGFPAPPFDALAKQWSTISPPATPTVALGPAQVTLGHDDPESDDLLPERAYDAVGRMYGWDNESPARTVSVGACRIAWRPVTNGEYEQWWRAGGCARPPPGSWAVGAASDVRVRTLYGPVEMDVAREWPFLGAYDDLAAYAAARGGRLPSEAELRLFLDMYGVGYEGGANVGFRNWHPVPATMGGENDGGKGCNGGVWEWTSTVFDTLDGFDPTTIFSGYSSDFFDSKHQVVLGASYATIPRLAGRRTVRNFYQHNYPYPWVAARIVYDV